MNEFASEFIFCLQNHCCNRIEWGVGRKKVEMEKNEISGKKASVFSPLTQKSFMVWPFSQQQKENFGKVESEKVHKKS